MVHLTMKRISLQLLSAFEYTGLFFSCDSIPNQKPKYATINDLPDKELPVIEAEQIKPPLIPAPITSKKPAKV